MHDSLVSLNLFNNENNTLINKVPILYYWNGEGDLLKDMINNHLFITHYLDNINYSLYKNLSMGYFYFTYDEDDNEYFEDNIINISDYINLDMFKSNNIMNEILVNHLFELYKTSMKNKYNDIQIFNEDIIIDIYDKIKEKYKEKLNKQTFINWIRNEILTKNNINNYNTNYIINYLEQILINKN